MTKESTHYEGDDCIPPHVVTHLEPENPDDVRARDKAHWRDIEVEDK